MTAPVLASSITTIPTASSLNNHSNHNRQFNNSIKTVLPPSPTLQNQKVTITTITLSTIRVPPFVIINLLRPSDSRRRRLVPPTSTRKANAKDSSSTAKTRSTSSCWELQEEEEEFTRPLYRVNRRGEADEREIKCILGVRNMSC